MLKSIILNLFICSHCLTVHVIDLWFDNFVFWQPFLGRLESSGTLSNSNYFKNVVKSSHILTTKIHLVLLKVHFQRVQSRFQNFESTPGFAGPSLKHQESDHSYCKNIATETELIIVLIVEADHLPQVHPRGRIQVQVQGEASHLGGIDCRVHW